MKITIDGKIMEVCSEYKNIVEVADKANISIAAPCYRNNKNKGCCNSCIVEIDGKKKYACVTKPQEGMNIIISREDLKVLRDERIKKYEEAIESSGDGCKCNCSSNPNSCC